MATAEARVARLEGKVAEHTESCTGMREALRHLEQRMDARFEAVERRFDALDDKTSRQFAWLMGLYVATLGAVVGALLARI